jgi:hypothetical protein
MVAISADVDKMNFRFFGKAPARAGNVAQYNPRIQHTQPGWSLHFIVFPVFLIFTFTLSPAFSLALEHVRFQYHGHERTEEGRIILEEQTAGIALESREGQLYLIEQADIIDRRSDDTLFVPYTKAEMIDRFKKEFPPSEGYHYLDTYGPFIIIYTTSKAFASLCGRLLERLHEQYVLHWKRFGVELTEPQFPMAAVVLSSEERYRQYAKQDNVTLLKEQCAYYHKHTNRIAVYDTSGQQALQEGNQRRATAEDTRSFLMQPGSLRNITAVIHEAAHQVGYNTGMHPRHAPSPVWLCEGLAVLHEVPDPRHRSGWTPGPHINRPRLDQLRQYLGTPRLVSPIQNMIQDDKLFAKPATALDNYALAWGVTYYLVKKRQKELVLYLNVLQAKKPDSDDSQEIRIKDFESCFGGDWTKFYKEFHDFVRRL